MTMFKPSATYDEAVEYLTDPDTYALANGSCVYVIQRHVSQSGMTRYLSLFVNTPDGMFDITHLVAAVFGEKMHREHHALRVTGCGMDMHFHTVYELANRLFNDGYALIHRTL